MKAATRRAVPLLTLLALLFGLLAPALPVSAAPPAQSDEHAYTDSDGETRSVRPVSAGDPELADTEYTEEWFEAQAEDHPDEVAYALFEGGELDKVVWLPADATARMEEIRELLNFDPEEEAKKLLDALPVPRARIGMNPSLGMVNVPTFFWMEWDGGYDGAPIEQSVTVLGETVGVTVAPTGYDWDFGDPESDEDRMSSDTPGEPWPAESEIRYVYNQASTAAPDGYEVRVAISWKAEWSAGGASKGELRKMVGDGASARHRVQELQSVLTQPDRASAAAPPALLSSEPPLGPARLFGELEEVEKPGWFKRTVSSVGRFLAEHGHAFLDVVGIFDPFGIADAINAAWYFAEGDVTNGMISLAGILPYGDMAKAARLGTRAAPDVAGRIVRGSDDAAGTAARGADDATGAGGRSADDTLASVCARANSFSANTLVATPSGPVPIAEVEVGDRVLAWHEATGRTGAYPVTATFAHRDPVLVRLVLGGETILTTPEHPFYTADGWDGAGELINGDVVRNSEGEWGAVRSVREIGRPRVMHNLTVAEAHTFFVGERAWLVHNAGCSPSELLAQNMEASGLGPRPAGSAAHHMVSHGPNKRFPEVAQSQAILKKHGIDINGADNGVYLPHTRTSPNNTGNPNASVHLPVHTTTYHRTVYARLRQADARGGKAAVERALRQIRRELEQGTFPF